MNTLENNPREHEISANEKHKDTVFKKLFGETEKLIPLYNALSGSNYPLDTHVVITTLENVIFKGRYNDLSFIVDGKLVVILEHQSTINPNMPLRILIYLAQVYNRYISKIKKVYSSELVKIPRPELIVLYNGVQDYPDESEMKLSDAFEDLPVGVTPSGSLELTARVLNINKGHNQNVVRKDRVLEEYAEFIGEIRKNQAEGMTMDEAMQAAVKSCVEKRILADFLEKYGSEVINMLYAEWDMDEYVATQVGEERARWKGIVAEKDYALAEKDSALAEKDSALAEKDSALAEKDSALASCLETIHKLQEELAKAKKN